MNLKTTPIELKGILPWQQNQWQQLYHVYANNKLPHAILLNGERGLGKFYFAKEFIKFLLCIGQHKNNLMHGCDQCKHCNLVQKETHPDLQILKLEENSNVIKIEQIKTLIAYTNNTAQFNGFKTAIIYPAEKMNGSAVNALLKNLEEPIGSSVLFILVTHQLMALPATIRSRCQRINFYVPALESLTEWFVNHSIDSTTTDFKFAYQLSQGAPLTLYQYLTDRKLIELFQMLNSLFIDDDFLISNWSNAFNKLPIIDFLHCLQLVVANLIKSNNEKTKYELYYLLDKVNRKKMELEKGISLNPQLIIEDFLGEIKRLKKESY